MDGAAIAGMTDAQVMEQLRSGSRLNAARAAFSAASARIEQQGAQRTPLGPIAARRMEFEAVVAILEACGLQCPKD